jgi:uncharacterized protein (TIGR02285 family)
MKICLITLSLLFLYPHGTVAEEQKEIYWLVGDLSQISQPTTTPISTISDTTRLLMGSLPEYLFNTEFTQNPRITRLLKKIPNSCSPNRVKNPERLQDNIYSLPLNIAQGLRLFYKEDSNFMAQPESPLNNLKQLTSLAALFTGSATHTLGMDKGRSFDIYLDEQINKLDAHNLVVRSGGEYTTSLVNMLLKNRIDYIIEYPIAVTEALNNLQRNTKLSSLEIAGSPSYIVGYIACNKGAAGERIIKNLNIALQQLYRSPAFYQAHIRYLDKKDIPGFNQAYQEVFQVNPPLK